jgi:hypothetical protein
MLVRIAFRHSFMPNNCSSILRRLDPVLLALDKGNAEEVAAAAAASAVVVDVADDNDDDDNDDDDDEGGITSWNAESLPGNDALTTILFSNSLIASGGVAEPALEGVEVVVVVVVVGADEEGVVIAVPAVAVGC